MRKWGYGVNSYHKTASILVEEAPFSVFLLEWIFDKWCGLIPCIPFPRILIKLRSKESIGWNNGNCWTTMKDWYGDLNSLFHLFVHDRVFEFCESRKNSKVIGVDYNNLKDVIYEWDKKFWDEQEDQAIKMREGYDND